jgi:hypothetical protein
MMDRTVQLELTIERLEKAARTFLRQFNPFDLTSDKSDQWHELFEECARATSVRLWGNDLNEDTND